MAHSSRSTADVGRAASNVASQTVSQIGDGLKEAAHQAFNATFQQADDVAANVGGSIRQLSDRIQANSPDGYLGCASEAVADRVRRGGEYLVQAKLSGAMDDVAELIKRNPIPAVLIAAGVAWLIARRI